MHKVAQEVASNALLYRYGPLYVLTHLDLTIPNDHTYEYIQLSQYLGLFLRLIRADLFQAISPKPPPSA